LGARHVWLCRLRTTCTGEGNKQYAPHFRQYMEPVITETDPDECVQEKHKVQRNQLPDMCACRLRNVCKDNLSCLTGKGNKRHVPQFREFMEPVITEMDPEECVEEQYKVQSSHSSVCIYTASIGLV